MPKRRNQALIDSDSSEDSRESESELENELLSLAKKKKLNGDSYRKLAPSDLSDSNNGESNTTKREKIKRIKKVSFKSSKAKSTKSCSENDSGKEESKASDLEEGEVSDSEESESESNEDKRGEAEEEEEEEEEEKEEEEFNDGYDDKYMGDEDDRRRLAEMTEKEREQEIFKRIEQREVLKTRFEIEKKLRLAKRLELKKQKEWRRKERDVQRKAKREQNKDRRIILDAKSNKKFSPASLVLKSKQREINEREEKRQSKDNEGESEDKLGYKTKLKASDVYSDDSGESSESSADNLTKISSGRKSSSGDERDSDSANDRENRRRKMEQSSQIRTKDELEKIRLSRHKVERFIHLPFFNRLVEGCFVKIGVGRNSNRMPVYIVAEICDVCEINKIYHFGAVRTNRVFKIRYGAQERIHRLEFVSNQEFTDLEFSTWENTCALGDIPLPTFDKLDQKLKDIKEAMTYQYREEDIEKLIREKEKLRQISYDFHNDNNKKNDNEVARKISM